MSKATAVINNNKTNLRSFPKEKNERLQAFFSFMAILLSSAIVTSTQSVQSRYKISRSPFVFKSAKQFAQRTLAQAQDSGKTQDNRTNPACCIGTISNYHVNITLLRFANQSQSATACKTAMIDMHLIG